MLVLHFAGAHILSGNVYEPRALNELFPDWKEQDVMLASPLHWFSECRRFLYRSIFMFSQA